MPSNAAVNDRRASLSVSKQQVTNGHFEVFLIQIFVKRHCNCHFFLVNTTYVVNTYNGRAKQV